MPSVSGARGPATGQRERAGRAAGGATRHGKGAVGRHGPREDEEERRLLGLLRTERDVRLVRGALHAGGADGASGGA